MAKNSVFVSYRRGDTRGEAGRLTDSLENLLDAACVFRDTDDIPAGEEFDAVLNGELAGTQAVVVLIGKQWLAELTARLARPDPDYVRMEVATALRSGKRSFLSCCREPNCPSAEQLPEDLRGLVGHQTLSVRDEAWNQDMGRLVDAIGRPYPWRKVAVARRARRTGHRDRHQVRHRRAGAGTDDPDRPGPGHRAGLARALWGHRSGALAAGPSIGGAQGREQANDGPMPPSHPIRVPAMPPAPRARPRACARSSSRRSPGWSRAGSGSRSRAAASVFANRPAAWPLKQTRTVSRRLTLERPRSRLPAVADRRVEAALRARTAHRRPRSRCRRP